MMATIIETLLRIKPNDRYIKDKLYSKKIAQSRNNYTAPKLKCNVDSYVVDGMNVYELYGEHEDRVVLYLHGGAYVAQPMVFQWNFATKLASKVNARVIVPMYPLAPEYTYKDAFEKVTNLYKSLLEKYGEIIIIGDSAGGGLELALSQYWQSLGINIPKKIIMLSPWLDITLTNENISKYECADPMLTKKDLQDCGSFWAGDTLTNDPKVSPIYSDIIPNTSMYIFAGTREIFCPDCIDYYAKLKKSNADVHLILGVGMNHVYPMYPIPEAHIAFKQIKNIIEG